MNTDERRYSFREELREDDALEIEAAGFVHAKEITEQLVRDASRSGNFVAGVTCAPMMILMSVELPAPFLSRNP